MVQVAYPGVYVQEIPSGVRTITGVSTSIAMFVGRTERGPLDKPTVLFNYTDFSRTFGTGTADSEMATSVRLFFENGGTQAYVMRIADGASSSEVTLRSQVGAPTLKVIAREAGPTGGNLRVQIDYNTPTPDSTFNMRVFRVDPATLVESQSEEFLNVSMDPAESRYAVDIVAQSSQLVTVEDLGADLAAGFTIGARMIPQANSTGIADATGIGDAHLRLRVNGEIKDYVFENGNIAGQIAADDLTVQYVEITGTLYLVRIISDNPGVSVEALPSGQTPDAATLLQMGPERGGIEARRSGAKRPAPSGLVADANDEGKIQALSILTQEAYDIVLAGTTIADIDPSTTGDDFHEGFASSVSSLLNVREKLTRIAAQFNTKASAQTHPWRCEVQGLRLVFRPTTGDANTGFNAALSTDAVALASAFDITPTNTRSIIVGNGNLSNFQELGQTGSPGNAPTINDYAAAYDVIRREVDLFNLLVLPRDTDIADEARVNLWGPASVFCHERRTLLNSLNYEEHYTLEDGSWRRVVGYQRSPAFGDFAHIDYASADGFTVRFGDGEFGVTPSDGSTFRIDYRTGPATASNVAADVLRHFGAGFTNVTELTNPLPVTDGVDPETAEELRQLAPAAFREQTYRAVRTEDYCGVAAELPWVEHAGARARWTGSWTSVFVTPDPQGTFLVAPARRAELEDRLDCRKQAGREVHVLDPRYRPVDLEILLCVAPGHPPSEVRDRVLTRLRGDGQRRGYFDPDTLTFGTPIYRLTLEAALRQVRGVRAVKGIWIAARGIHERREMELVYRLPDNQILRLANDPRFPERGSVKVITEGV